MLRAVWRTALRKPLFSPPPHPAFFHSTPSPVRNGRANLTTRFHFENETDMRQVLLQDEGRDRQPSKDEDISWHAEGKGGLNEEDDSDDFDGQPETKNYGKSKPHHSSGKHKHNRSKHFILLL